jgi:hypothetical protein
MLSDADTTTPEPALAGDRRLNGDDGVAVALTALLIIPLLAFVSLGVDVGAWYARAQQIQQAADAAALAAAPLTPDPVATQAAALATLRKNQIDCTQFGGNVICTMGGLPNSDIAYRVTITDPTAPQFFSQAFRGDVTITRKATAERLHPIPMGSPNNYLGTNQLISVPERENFWLAVSGKCASKEQGDRRMPVSDANWTATPSYRSCNDGLTETNTEHDPDGYTYVMNLAQNYSGTVHLEVYDPVFCANSAMTENPANAGGARHQFRYRVLGRANFPAAAPLLREWIPPNTDTACSAGSDGSTTQFRGAWVTLHQFSNPQRGQYYLQVADPSGSAVTTNRNSNQFAVRARFDGPLRAPRQVAPTTWARCSTIVGSTNPPYRGDCPQIHGYRDMSVFAGVGASVAEFYLTDVGVDYNGRTMEILLWDPGEGMASIELLDPLRNPVTFNWESLDCAVGATPPAGGCSGQTALLNVSGTGPPPGPYRLSTSRYNDRPIRLTYRLPDNIGTAYGGRTWWKIRYGPGATPNDRTTWSVQIPGDPVRLVPTLD